MRRINTVWMVAVAALLWSSQATALSVAPCSDDNPCPDGTSCFGGDCLPTCASDEDCGEGFDCLIATFSDPTPMPAPCPDDDPDCSDEPEADPVQPTDGVCIELPETCTSDDDCADGEVCQWGPTLDTTEPAMPPEEEGGSGEGGSDDTPMPGGEGAPNEGICVPGDTWESECEVDEDCASGMICVEVGATTVVSDQACVCPNGEEDCDCGEMPEPQPQPEPKAYYACVPAPCDTDADCGDDLVCITNTYEACAPTPWEMQVPCAEDDPDCGDDAEPPAEDPAPDCETITESYCGPKYLANCEVDADCGEGFACVEEEMCACSAGSSGGTDFAPDEPGEGSDSGSAGAPAAPGTEPEPEEEGDDEEDCTCEPTGEMICELDELPCQSDDDCALEGWTCQMMGTMTSVPCSFDPATGEEDCGEPVDAPESAGQCVPETWGWGSGSDMGYTESASSGVGTNSGGEGPGDPSVPEPDTGNGNGSGSGSGSGSEPASTGGGGGGCQGGSHTGNGLLCFALLALALVTRRRHALEG